ncbi:hypothetical protein [Deinococcus sp. 12RED42]|uniref:hypothetical protein n=1 Tax=Deinococcus sp. 12RED42 TaxID=2745872 RepID=UPI0021058553|nr:hypothetical protein [Deinococcus sp. 12RED42]
MGRPVLIHTHEGPLEGVATDLDAQGSLIVTTAHGPRTVSAGDVQLVGSLAPELPEPSGSGPAP